MAVAVFISYEFMRHQNTHTQDTADNIKIAFFLNLGFTVFELFGGIWTNSMAIISDALHDLGDSFSLGLCWYLERYSKKGKDKRYSYGYRRFSLLGALTGAVVLIIGALFVLSKAIPRLIHPQLLNAKGMVVFAMVGIIVNGLAALRVRGSKTLNVQLVAWHLLEDVLGWVAILFVSVTLLFKDIYILDPILSIVVILYVLYNVVINLKKTLALFLQAVPYPIDLNKIEDGLLAIDKVESVHHAHIWSLDGEHHVLTTHLVVTGNITKEDILNIKRQAKTAVENLDLEHITIEIEYEDEECKMNECQ